MKDAALPAQVRAALRRQELESERLIGWAQLVVGIAWTVLYAFAPKTFPAGPGLEPVPLALAAYIVFSVLRLGLTYLTWPPRWFLALSVLIDMALLMTLIWSFHLQYGQPAAFYLKAPTLLYVFIFISLRALRFSAAYVMLAGAAAAAGWLALLWYALASSDAPDMGVTRDYVAYMTSAQVLIGAEFDKIITILLTTSILALAILRARKLLITSVVESTAHRELSRFFAPEVARQIVGADSRIQPGQGELRQAAILVCDIRRFTPLAMTMSPDALMALLAEYEERMVPVILRHGGSIDKFMGDGIMATFGAAVASRTYAADALECVQALGETAAEWRRDRVAQGLEPLEIGFAVACGTVVFGAVGHGERLEFTVIGEPVNLAAKLEQANKTEAVHALTTADCLSLALGQGFPKDKVFERRQDRPVAGLVDPQDLVVLLA